MRKRDNGAMNSVVMDTHTGVKIHVTRSTMKNVDFLRPLAKGTVVTPTTDDSCVWWLAQHEGKIIGAVCAKDMGKGKWRMRCDIVAPEFRKQGVYAVLSSLRENYCKTHQAVELNCFSSQYSRGTFERAGYVIDGDPDKDNVFMRKVL